MLRITTQQTAGELVMKLEGCVAGAWVDELSACWTAATTNITSATLVDLSAVYWVDASGRRLLAEMHRGGARFLTSGCFMRELIREISTADDLGWRN
jgi:ABC-type transporter Mla MlaB component